MATRELALSTAGGITGGAVNFDGGNNVSISGV
jgi:hypothetical protein